MSFMVVERVRMAQRRTLPAREGVRDHDRIIVHDTSQPVEHRTYLRMHGFSKPTIFKTLRNAMKAAREWFGTPRRGFVVKFDPSLLPIVFDAALDDELEPRTSHERWRDAAPTWEVDPHDAEDLDAEFALAERQMLLWQDRMVKVKTLMDAAPIVPKKPKRRQRNTSNRPTEE